MAAATPAIGMERVGDFGGRSGLRIVALVAWVCATISRRVRAAAWDLLDLHTEFEPLD